MPGLGITTVAATTGLLCGEEADIAGLVRARVEAVTANLKNTTFLQGTVPE